MLQIFFLTDSLVFYAWGKQVKRFLKLFEYNAECKTATWIAEELRASCQVRDRVQIKLCTGWNRDWPVRLVQWLLLSSKLYCSNLVFQKFCSASSRFGIINRPLDEKKCSRDMNRLRHVLKIPPPPPSELFLPPSSVILNARPLDRLNMHGIWANCSCFQVVPICISNKVCHSYSYDSSLCMRSSLQFRAR